MTKLREYFAGRFVAQEAKKLMRDSSVAEQRTHNPKVVGSNPSPATPRKFRNVETDGYHSKREAMRAADLKRLQRLGLIRNLKEQVQFVLIPKQQGERAVTYTADFTYEEGPLWMPVVEDSKGYPDDRWPIKRKLMLIVHGVRVRVT